MSYYRDLGVGLDAPPDEIDAAYERLRDSLSFEREVLEDAGDHGTTAELERQVEAAYAVLSDPERRRDYDSSLGEVCPACTVPRQADAEACAWCGHRFQAPRVAGGASPTPLGALPLPPPEASRSSQESAVAEERPRRPGFHLALAIRLGLVVALIGAGLVVTQLSREDGDSGPNLNEDHLVADHEWALPEVVPLVRFVERDRGLRFRRPVPIELLAPDEFQDRLAALAAEHGDEAADEALAAETGVLRALGLYDGDFRPEAHLGDPDLAVLGLYDWDSRTILVASEDVDLFTEVTLAHELTHALQDQYFDLGRMEALETDGARLGFATLFEGDATRVQAHYVERLSAGEQQRYAQQELAFMREVGELAPQANPDEDAPPAVYGAYAMTPYVLGVFFVELVAQASGEEAVDKAFHTPPDAEQHILDPWAFIDGEETRPLDPPELGEGEKRIDDGDLGVLTWYLFLAERIDAVQALRAVDGWRGDSYLTMERGGQVCIRARFQGETNADNAEMGAALDAWVAQMPGTASVARFPTYVEMISCDPGAGVHGTGSAAGERAIQALVIPLFRSAMAIGLLHAGVTEGEARCAGTALSEGLTLDEILNLAASEISGNQAAIPPVIEEIMATCLSPGR